MPPIGGTAAPVFLYLQAVPVPSAAQPTPVAASNAPPGIVASTTVAPVASLTSTRTPFATGSSGGEYGNGMTISPLKRSLSSPGGVLRSEERRVGIECRSRVGAQA